MTGIVAMTRDCVERHPLDVRNGQDRSGGHRRMVNIG